LAYFLADVNRLTAWAEERGFFARTGKRHRRRKIRVRQSLSAVRVRGAWVPVWERKTLNEDPT
jgi:hypothetical protein